MKIMSMTGFGEGSAQGEEVEVSVELKSVNHRFLDVVCKLPGMYSRFETDLVKMIRERLKRGRVELFVARRDAGEASHELLFKRELFESYLDVLRQAFKGVSLPERHVIGSAVANVLNRREVLELVPKETDAANEYQIVEKALSEALDKLVEMRRIEGAELEREILSQLDLLERVLGEIGAKTESTPIDFKERLTQRIERLGGGIEIDPDRLMQEVAFLADRIDITEELARLHSHIQQFRQIVDDSQGGRKLEFLLQEIIREINTAGSKAQNSEVTSLVVEAKAVVEKLREQVQNVE